jgi:hypothetical protein
MTFREHAVPRDDHARDEWSALTPQTRKSVIRDARRGKAANDERVSEIAVGWAWVVLGAPGARRRVSIADRLLFVFDVIMTTPGSNVGMNILDGSARYDKQPWVRHVARRIERANYRDSS